MVTRAGFGAEEGNRKTWLESRLTGGRCDMNAIAPSHKHAILSPTQIRDAHGKPYSDRGQRHGERKSRDVCQHAMAEIVRFISLPLIARQIVGLA